MDPLFDMVADWGPTRFIRCGYCPAAISATVIRARVCGWRVLEGSRSAAQPLRDAICPECYRRETIRPDRKYEGEIPLLTDTALYDADDRGEADSLGEAG